MTRLVTQEVAMIKQSGANSLAVSLKIDPQTELFLQLTNHDGQIQASLRCERGSMAGLDTHWGQLQESLSRQNVQLLPLEEKFSSRASVGSGISGPSSPAGTFAILRLFPKSGPNPRLKYRHIRFSAHSRRRFENPQKTGAQPRRRRNK